MSNKRIICIHALDEHTFSPEKFLKYVFWIKKMGYIFVSLDTILSEKKGKFIALTVDDAYKTCVTRLIPILDMYNIPATLFVSPSMLNKNANDNILLEHNMYPDEMTMDWEDLNLWKGKGYEVGFHTNFHIDMYDSSDEVIIQDFHNGFNLLAQRGFLLVKYFAYPFGYIPKNRKMMEGLFKKYDIQYAFTVNWGSVKRNSHFNLNRICLGDNDNLIWLILKTIGVLDGYYKIRRLHGKFVY